MDTQTQFDRLSSQAKMAGQAGQWAAARAHWVDALGLFPSDSPEYRDVETRIRNIDAQLEYARQERLNVVPLCPFVASYIRRHQEYLDLVSPERRAAVLETSDS